MLSRNVSANLQNRTAINHLEPGEVSSKIRAAQKYSNPAIRYIEIDVAPVKAALVRRRPDGRRAIQDLEECSRDIAAGLVDNVKRSGRRR